jgi:serine/threonine protein phosphatase PrpC
LTAALGAGDTIYPAWRSTARSHLGLVRPINEDRAFNHAAAGLWAVADGMGGHGGGDIAAQIVVDTLRDLVLREPRPTLHDVRVAVDAANRAIVQRNCATGMQIGATIVLALCEGTQVHLVWAGDSRAYRLVDGTAHLQTRDHSVVQELVDAGLLSADAALRHPLANVVTRALGVAETVTIETRTIALAAGERLLLCSDGLSRSLDEQAVPAAADIERLADTLIAQALVRDGADNASLVIVDGALQQDA